MTEYWVPMREYEGGPKWRQVGRGDTPEEAKEDALDNYEENHGFRPIPDGEPEEADL